jgi:hypothetical protein
MTLRRDICVLGAGPAGLFAATWLRTYRGIRATVIGVPRFGMLRPALGPTGPISLVPILPPVGSTSFPPSIHTDQVLCTQYVGRCDRLFVQRHAPGSFAWYSASNLTPRAQALAHKQFGTLARTSPLLEVRAKIARTYVNHAAPANRAGYIHGESPYVGTMRAAAAAAELVDRTVVSIDHRRRRVRFADGGHLDYGSMVLTIPLPQIARLLAIPYATMTCAAAEFVVARCVDVPANLLIYDSEPDSPMFRVISPRTGIVVVQLALTEARTDRLTTRCVQRLRRRLTEAIGSPTTGIDPTIRRVEMAYPTDPPDAAFLHRLETVAEAGNIVRLGRFAEWRYVDLHELEWTARLGV